MTAPFHGGYNPVIHIKRGQEGETRRKVYEFIVIYADEHGGNSPSILEVARHLDMQYGTVYGAVMRMIARNKLARRDGKILIVGSEWIPPL